MADVTLTYKGNTIAEMSASGSKTLLTSGKYCEANIGVEYAKPSGGDTPPSLPAGYTPMLYLEASGTQCIDTGKYAKLNSKGVVDGNLKDGDQSSYVSLFGSNNPYFMPFASNWSVPNSTGTWTSFGNINDVSTQCPMFIRGIYSLDKNVASVKYDNTDMYSYNVGASSITENQNSHICLFARGNNGSYERFVIGRIYEYSYYENDVLLQHMYPAKRKADNVLGMYDVVNDEFFTNAGTGVFIGGEW